MSGEYDPYSPRRRAGKEGKPKGERNREATEELRDAETTSTAQTVAAGQLRALIERIETLEEGKKDVSESIKEVYAEAKGTGFDTKAIRTIVRLRKKDQAERQEEEAIVDLYKAALGMV
jgi:uncharacterized protein (UPF0335 family)